MSLKIIKTGLLDTVQDNGRFGFQHQGINPGGAMDQFSASLANALLGKELHAPVIEMHFPAPWILFQKRTVICIAGADFRPMIHDREIAVHQPVTVNEGAVLSFKEKRYGARCYLTVLGDLQLTPWLGSYSTNLKAAVGGWNGKRLEKEDEIPFAETDFDLEKKNAFLPWKYHAPEDGTNTIGFIQGPEWNWLTVKSQTFFLNDTLSVTPASDRMGYRLQGKTLEQKQNEQLVSSAVSFGTVQLLPNGQLIVLMADHQTTGGYPRIVNVIKAQLPKLAQMNAGDKVKFEMTNVKAAEEKWMAQQRLLNSLQNTCKLKLQNWFDAHRY